MLWPAKKPKIKKKSSSKSLKSCKYLKNMRPLVLMCPIILYNPDTVHFVFSIHCDEWRVNIICHHTCITTDGLQMLLSSPRCLAMIESSKLTSSMLHHVTYDMAPSHIWLTSSDCQLYCLGPECHEITAIIFVLITTHTAYKGTFKQCCSLQVYFLTKARVVGTHLNCMDLLSQFK